MTSLFIPGPTDVAKDVLHAQSKSMIGHRSDEFLHLMQSIQPRLQTTLQTSRPVFIATSSGTGLQEAAVRNCAGERLLVAECGAFGERWYKVARANGIRADRVSAEWGMPNHPETILEALQGGSYDALAIVHNETSTGVENPIEEIAREL